ncbi:MAG: hypothetical protein ACI8UO_005067 [Verrucomicrobiales bacterium]|jgi:hypothetical protein
MIFKIVSGGQTGVDRAALDAAIALGVSCGGWCPAGRVDEQGVIPEHYPLKELKKGGYKLRTVQNMIDSDATLIFYFGDLEGGTEETTFRCIKNRKPYKLIDGSELTIVRSAQLAADFVEKFGIKTLNVAGPRESKCPEAYDYSYAAVVGLLEKLGLSAST